MIKSIYYIVVFILFTTIAFLVFVIVWLLALPFDKNRIISHHYSRLWANGIYKIYPPWHVKVEGRENIAKNQSYIVVSNHQSMLDIPLLYKLPFNFKWVSKEEVFRIPVFGWVLWMHDDIAIKRGGVSSAKSMLDKCDKMLKRGISINIFPEGTRTTTGRVNEFKPGSFLLAKKSKVPILPVVINGNFDAFKTGEKGKNRIKSPHTFTVKILPPISVEQTKELRFDELSTKIHNIILAEHRAIAPQFYTDETDPITEKD